MFPREKKNPSSHLGQCYLPEYSLKPNCLMLVLNEKSNPRCSLFMTQNGKVLHVSRINSYHSPIIQHDTFSMFGNIKSVTGMWNKVLWVWTMLGSRMWVSLMEWDRRVFKIFYFVVKAHPASTWVIIVWCPGVEITLETLSAL